ncbi:hypothetical protein Taro_050970, partial [Colocasia esculenta]|nr:hypothetical protein [Colocasia esculenta]
AAASIVAAAAIPPAVAALAATSSIAPVVATTFTNHHDTPRRMPPERGYLQAEPPLRHEEGNLILSLLDFGCLLSSSLSLAMDGGMINHEVFQLEECSDTICNAPLRPGTAIPTHAGQEGDTIGEKTPTMSNIRVEFLMRNENIMSGSNITINFYIHIS